jgi:hypothetical protein
MKISKEEQKRRIDLFNEDLETYKKVLEKIKNAKSPEEKDLILESEEYQEINNKFSLGPTYIIWKEDYEDPDYRIAFGVHPSEIDVLKRAYEEGYYGALVDMVFWKGDSTPKRCIGLGYDYGDYYYVIEDNEGGYFFETMVSPVKIIKDHAAN